MLRLGVATMPRRGDSWADGPIVGFDVESSGLDVFNDRIVTACVVHVMPGKRPDFHRWLVNPGVPIPAEAQAVHGVSTEYAQAHGVEPAAALFAITSHVAFALHRGIPVVAMNAPYDLTILEAENERHQVDTLASRLDNGIRPILDPLVIDRRVVEKRKGKGQRKMPALCGHYGLPVTDAHDSSADALMAVRVVQVMARREPEQVAGRSLVDLHEAQIAWHMEWAASFTDWLRKKGDAEKADGVSSEWPLQTRVKAVA